WIGRERISEPHQDPQRGIDHGSLDLLPGSPVDLRPLGGDLQRQSPFATEGVDVLGKTVTEGLFSERNVHGLRHVMPYSPGVKTNRSPAPPLSHGSGPSGRSTEHRRSAPGSAASRSPRQLRPSASGASASPLARRQP